MTYNEKNKQWWIFENPNDKSLSVVYHSNPKWIAERDTLYHVIEHTAYQQALEQIAKLCEALTLDRESPRELLALMSEGEGNDVEVYQIMARSGLKKLDEALAELKKWRGEND